MTRLLVVGWDGATWSVADPLARAGRLPMLASLREEDAAEGVLETVPNMNSAPAWSTVATGLNPGRHGIFYFDEPVPGTYRRRVINATRRSGASLWRMASDAGKRTVVVNVPISFPAEPVNGYLIAGLDSPSKTISGFTYPQGLTARHPGLFDRYTVDPGAPSLIKAGKVQEAKDELLQITDGWTSVTERLMEEEWDLVFVVFTATDTAQHFFWTGEGRQVVEQVYQSQDEGTARLVEKARTQDPDVNVIVLADHGGAVNTRGPELMPVWLEDQGLQAFTAPSVPSRALSTGFRVVDRTLTREQKLALARRFPRLRERAESEVRLAGLHWKRTRAYSDGLRDEVFVNLAGREPEGSVPNGEYQGLVEELKEGIEGIREMDTGEPVVESVRHRDELYHGPHVDLAPDLTLRWLLEGREAPFRGFECETRRGREKMRALVAEPPFTDGGHHGDGMFLAAGPNIRPGYVRGRLEDVTPTVLALLGIPAPAGLDGRPLDLLKDVEAKEAKEAKAAQAAERTPAGLRESPAEVPAARADRDPATGYTAEEEEEVRRRLEELGYL